MTAPTPSHLNSRSWYWALVVTFGLHGVYFATWVSRTPETQAHLNLDTGQYGFFAMIMGLGGLLSVILGGRVIGRYGSRRVLLVSYIALGITIALSGGVITCGLVPLAGVLSFLLGVCASFGGFANNVEGTSVDRASHRSLLPSLHGFFSGGMLLGSALGAVLIASSFPLWANFAVVGILVAGGGMVATRFIPRDGGLHITPDMDTAAINAVVSKTERRRVWRERRTVVVSAIGLAFVLAEATAATWLPITLVTAGMSAQDGAVAFTCFAIAMTVGRLLGGLVVERSPRPLLISLQAIVAIAGIVLVMLTGIAHLPYLGATLWGLGASLGFPLVSAALAEEPRMATARLRVLLVFGNVGGLTSGPVLGIVGQLTNLFVALSIPAGFLAAAGSVSRSARPLPRIRANVE